MESLTQQFLTFCRSKPADEEYDYLALDNCALSQFLRECGYAERPSCSHAGWRDDAKGEPVGAHPLPQCFAHGGIMADTVLVREPNTFGALALRLETALAEQTA